jgi:hypothetical protein
MKRVAVSSLLLNRRTAPLGRKPQSIKRAPTLSRISAKGGKLTSGAVGLCPRRGEPQPISQIASPLQVARGWSIVVSFSQRKNFT